MARTPAAIVLLVLCLSWPPLLSATPSLKPNRGTSKHAPAASFIPSASFLSILRSTLEEIQQVTSLVNNFAGGFSGGDLRLSSAISDCLDLLDLSSDELTWTLSASQPSPASAISGTGNRRSDLQSWLSAALGNQETCKEGLDNTDSILGSIIADSLESVTSFISDGLGDMASFGGGWAGGGGGGWAGGGGGGGGRRRLMEFPEWVSAGDRRLLQAPASVAANAVVAQDGSGDYTTVSAAVAAAPSESASRYVIYVKKGLYKENVEVKKKKWNIMLVGEGMGQTVISGSRSFVDGWTTYRSATFAVAGKGFIARDLTIENTAGPHKHQAVALRSDSDLSVFYRCSFSGYQDTLYAHSLRQFYRDCLITGTVDFIFGNAAAVFQNCQIMARRPLSDQKNSVTAQGRKDPGQNTGFSFQFCNISADADLQQLASSANATASYLGRPWKEYSRTVVMQSYIGAFIRPEGWLEWNGDFALSTLYYAEYMNTGPGAGLANRVKWPGFHAISDPALVANFTVAQFIDGNLWLPSTGVKYTAGLSV